MTLDLNNYSTEIKFDFPVIPISYGTEMGKTKNWIDFVVAGIRQYERIYPNQNYYCVLAVPRHKLGDEVAQRLAEHGITAHVYRGREAPDPDTANQKMCRDLKRTEEITSALGDVARQACKNGKGECPAFNICGYQAQQKQKPQVWIVPYQLLFRERLILFLSRNISLSMRLFGTRH